MIYQVRLTQFEGPLDLLLHLIRRDKINIYDIPISHITREYLSYLETIRELKLELAGEFLVMAATLMRIKAQMLLPRRAEDEEEEEDPREELVKNLLEYRKFKEAASHLQEREEISRKLFGRPETSPPGDDTEVQTMEVSVFDLVDAFKKVMEELKKQVSYRIEREIFSIEEKVGLIEKRISDNSEVLFTELFADQHSKAEIIVTFLALLEMVKQGKLIARQMSQGSDIWLYRPGSAPAVTPEEKEDDIARTR
ncbi:MAG: segregation/condensation protein A [Candidatus Krumholzibacteriota bacterium]|nr:segregation/condensation protein A [Candidatus Krumholzibacteriota bacterium]